MSGRVVSDIQTRTEGEWLKNDWLKKRLML